MKNIIIISTIISTIFAEGISGVSYFRYAMGSTTDGEDHGFYIDRAYLTYKKDVLSFGKYDGCFFKPQKVLI